MSITQQSCSDKGEISETSSENTSVITTESLTGGGSGTQKAPPASTETDSQTTPGTTPGTTGGDNTSPDPEDTTTPGTTAPPVPDNDTPDGEQAVYAAPADGIYYLDEAFMCSKLTTTNMLAYPSGWDVDSRGGELIMLTGSEFSLWDKSGDFPVTLNREITEIKSGIATFETAFIIRDDDPGFYYSLKNAQNEQILRITIENGSIGFYDQAGSFCPITKYEVLKEYGIVICIDFDNRTAEISVNGIKSAKCPLTAAAGLKYLTIGTTEASQAYVTLKFVKIYANYLVNETFSNAGSLLSDRWTVNAASNSYFDVGTKNGASYPDLDSLKLFCMGAGKEISAKTAFARVKGTAVFELAFLIPKKADGISFSLLAGDGAVLSVSTEGGQLVCGSQRLYDYTENIWYTLRIEADTTTGSAAIRLNGREIGTVSFTAGYIDGIRVTNNASVQSQLWIDDVIVYSKSPEPEDYVPAPVPAKSDGYYIGLQSCSLWRNGYNIGWDCITAFDEIKPYLGYYDEGSSEVADWEIKWMVEHGIDYNLYCWYFPLNWNKSDPIKTPYNSGALHNGYFNAKYSDQMKYAIMWENYNAVVTSQIFREKIVPYWVEYYLKDPRYMTIDNKPLIAVYQWNVLLKSFGSAAGVRAELDYLRQVCKGLGYDGAIIMIQCSDLDKDNLQTVSTLGFDVMYRYSWGGTSNVIQNQTDKMQTQKKLASLDVMPTISMGYNNVAWNALRSDYVSLSDYRSLLQWAKNTFMKSYSQSSLASRMLMLDNWNEYGEGHYLMPSSLAGFGYLDAIRDVFTGASTSHSDIVPTAAQKSRFSYLFPQDRVALRHLFTDAQNSGGYILKIDGEAQKLDQTPVVNNNVLLVPLNPVNRLAEKLNAVYLYDGLSKTITLSTDYAKIEFTLGGSTALINGKTVSMGCSVYRSDGLPMIPLKLVCEAFGYTMQFNQSSKTITVKTNMYSQRTADLSIINGKTAFAWEFDVNNDFEKWTPGAAVYNYRAVQSALSGKVRGSMGTLLSPALQMAASSNRFLHIRLKCTSLYTNVLNIGFTTADDKSWTSSKQISVSLSSTGGYADYVVDMGQCAAWKGTIAQIKFDLCIGGGAFEIDYIRFNGSSS